MYCFTCSRLDWLAEKWAVLPLEVGVIATAFLQPEVRDAFQFLHPFGLRDGASESCEQMDMVLHAADEDGRAIELFGDAAEIRVERVARGFVAQERPAVFGEEDQMNVNGGKGLRHDAIVMPNRGDVCQSQRDCVHQPRVARNELPWVIVQQTCPTATRLRPFRLRSARV
jgi:hypothetical protein